VGATALKKVQQHRRFGPCRPEKRGRVGDRLVRRGRPRQASGGGILRVPKSPAAAPDRECFRFARLRNAPGSMPASARQGRFEKLASRSWQARRLARAMKSSATRARRNSGKAGSPRVEPGPRCNRCPRPGPRRLSVCRHQIERRPAEARIPFDESRARPQSIVGHPWSPGSVRRIKRDRCASSAALARATPTFQSIDMRQRSRALGRSARPATQFLGAAMTSRWPRSTRRFNSGHLAAVMWTTFFRSTAPVR